MSQGGGKKRKLPPTASVTFNHDASSTTESDLLASLGSTMQNMEDYEQDVLKTAELEQTPRISGQGGFPPSLVSSLAPSGHALSDMTHFQTLLAKVRQRLAQQPHNPTLLLQQQMLLNVIHTTTNDAEACLRPQEEQRDEQLRMQRFRRPLNKEANRLRTTDPVPTDHRKKAPKSALKRTTNDQALAEDEGAAAHRLEEIKKQQKTVLFASTAIAAPRRRIGIQKRRVKTVSDEEETEEELQRRKEHLKQLRVAREKRREKRRMKWLARNPSHQKQHATSGGQKKQDDDSDEEEMNFDMDVTESVGEANERPPPDTPNQPPPVAAASIPPTPLFQTICPLCQEEVDAMSQEALDECLSRHMTECQTSLRRTRARRHSPRRAAHVLKSYAEDDTNNSIVKEGSDEDEAVVPALEEGDDDDDDEIFGETGLAGEDDDDTRRTQGSNGIPPPTPLDDFEEDDYEDRVDEWIVNGIDRMRVMKERDEAESPPGEEVYEGGLTIPAWVNDNLFPYQRTGLQWMWELHKQQAGGIIGGTFGNFDARFLCGDDLLGDQFHLLVFVHAR